MDKIKKIIASEAYWYIARVFWCAIPVGIIISRCNVFEVFLFIAGAAIVLNISHEVISAEIKHALESGHITIQSNVSFKVKENGKEKELKIDDKGNFTEVSNQQK